MGDTRFVITGCQRSGTTYASALMRELGISCGHEFFFRPGAPCFLNPSPPRGESSWCAAPYLYRLPPGTAVFHQVRHPLHVIRSSLSRTTVFDKRNRDTVMFRKFIDAHCPDAASECRVSRCISYWVLWNQMVEKSAVRLGLPYMRYRVEDMDSDTVSQMLGMISEPPPPNLNDVIQSVPRNLNQKRVRHASSLHIAWDDLPPGEMKQQAENMALLYGYEI